MPKPDTTTKAAFISECHFSETGFALWKWNERGINYCTCDPRPKPSGWIDEDGETNDDQS